MVALMVAFLVGAAVGAALYRAASAGDRRDTPLHISCRRGNVKAVKCLLDRGADPNVVNYLNQTPLQLACSSDDAAIVKMLLDKAADSNDSAARTSPYSDSAAPCSAVQYRAGNAIGPPIAGVAI